MMESHQTGTSSDVSTGIGEPSSEEYEKYKLRARGKYKELMNEFEFRCQRAAMMNYHDASQYTKHLYQMEIVVAFLGGVFLTTIGSWLLEFNNISQLGGVCLVGVIVAFIFEFLSKVIALIIPSFSRREEKHVTVGASWQALALKTGSYRIQLDNPMSDVPKYDEWYRELITERKEICSMASIPNSTYEEFDDPKRLLEKFIKRKQLFQDFLKLQNEDDN